VSDEAIRGVNDFIPTSRICLHLRVHFDSVRAAIKKLIDDITRLCSLNNGEWHSFLSGDFGAEYR
jgi:hypothetical protein